MVAQTFFSDYVARSAVEFLRIGQESSEVEEISLRFQIYNHSFAIFPV